MNSIKLAHYHLYKICLVFPFILLIGILFDINAYAWGFDKNPLSEPEQAITAEEIPDISIINSGSGIFSDFGIGDSLLSIPTRVFTRPLCRNTGVIAPDDEVVILQEAGPERKEFVLLASYTENVTARNAVNRHIQLFTTRKRKNFGKWLERSGRYLETIKAILRENGLPEDLVYLPLIESGYSTAARSRAHAVGPWQFIESTAKRYGLKIDYWRDERRDPIKSTVAAARHLGDLHDKFGSWALALAAYNAGEGKIRRALRKSRSDNYWRIIRTRYVKRETKNYVSKFIAAGIIASDPEKYGFTDIDYHSPLSFEEVEINGPASLSFIAGCSGTSVKGIRKLNPELKRWCTPPHLKTYRVRIPEGVDESFKECFYNAPPHKRMPKVPYIVKKGDTLYEIAKRFRIPRKELYTLNRGIKPRRLRLGSIIYLPPSGGDSLQEGKPNVPYIIKKGDTLHEIAKRLRISTRRLYALNKGINPRRLMPGSIIYLPPKR